MAVAIGTLVSVIAMQAIHRVFDGGREDQIWER
jgi:hypothetical protein